MTDTLIDALSQFFSFSQALDGTLPMATPDPAPVDAVVDPPIIAAISTAFPTMETTRKAELVSYVKTIAMSRNLTALNVVESIRQSAYYVRTIADLSNVSNYALKTDLPNLTGYALKTDLPNLTGYALKTDLPSLTDYALKSEVAPAKAKVLTTINSGGFVTLGSFKWRISPTDNRSIQIQAATAGATLTVRAINNRSTSALSSNNVSNYSINDSIWTYLRSDWNFDQGGQGQYAWVEDQTNNKIYQAEVYIGNFYNNCPVLITEL